MAYRVGPVRLPEFGVGLREAWRVGYGLTELRRDVLAGVSVGAVAVPLSMALAIATGVAPQHGLYTAIIAGALIALTGGARFNVSGPTAAFVVLLIPIVQQHGPGGLLVATMMAGFILLALGVARLGRLIQFVPYPVVLGFTAGIAVVIAGLQLPDFLGLEMERHSGDLIQSLGRVAAALPEVRLSELAVGALTLVVLIFASRWRLPVPPPLLGLAVAAVVVFVLDAADMGMTVETIASRFSWEAEGEAGRGIPPIPPGFRLPWHWPGPEGRPLAFNFELIRTLLGPAFALAALAAIESLLCSVVADGLTQTRHDPNAELVGQGLGNIIAPFFGGITATAAIARTATNVRSGAYSPIAAVVHAVVVLLAVVAFAGLLGLVPMAALAALLLVVAWHMSEARHFLHTLRSAPAGDVAILLVCFGLTVLFDMVVAVAVGVGLAAALFIRRMALLSESDRVERGVHPELDGLAPRVAVYDVNGPLFFGAAEKALSSLRTVDPQVRIVILDMRDVPSIDGTAIVALSALVAEMQHRKVALILVGLPASIILTLRRAGIHRIQGELSCRQNPAAAAALAKRWLDSMV